MKLIKCKTRITSIIRTVIITFHRYVIFLDGNKNHGLSHGVLNGRGHRSPTFMTFKNNSREFKSVIMLTHSYRLLYEWGKISDEHCSNYPEKSKKDLR